MEYTTFINTPAFELIILPFLIFLARVSDVTLDTIRIVFISQGRRYLATALGFFGILIWLFAISKVLQHLSNPIHAIAYAAGFATGNFVGITIENRIALGRVIVRVITRRDASNLIVALRESGYGLTVVPAQGLEHPVSILFSVVNRHDLTPLMHIIRSYNPKAFVSVENIRETREGFFRQEKNCSGSVLSRLALVRKGK